MTIPNDTLLFCPFDGQKITMANDTACCPIHGYFTAIFEEWAQLANSVRYEYQGELLRFTDEKAIVELLKTNSVETRKPEEFGDMWNRVLEETTTEVETSDEITKPSHYNQYTGFEVMDVCRQLVSPDATPASTWFRGNVFKYLARAGWKTGDGKELQDLEKAGEYLRKELERVKTRDDALAASKARYYSGGIKAAEAFLEDGPDENVQAMREYLGGIKLAKAWLEAGADPTPTGTDNCPECGVILVKKPKDANRSCPNHHGFYVARDNDSEWISTPTKNTKPSRPTTCGNEGCIEHKVKYCVYCYTELTGTDDDVSRLVCSRHLDKEGRM